MDEDSLADFRERIEVYMLKAAREAKIQTSWINPDTDYEAALAHFVRSVLGSLEKNPFLMDFLPFQRRVARFGLLNGLSQLLLKLTAPGVPDLYQGSELWGFSLADPDNRRSVDFALRQRMLQEVMGLAHSEQPLHACARELLKKWEDGRVKLYLIRKILALRARLPLLFQEGDYSPLVVEGKKPITSVFLPENTRIRL